MLANTIAAAALVAACQGHQPPPAEMSCRASSPAVRAPSAGQVAAGGAALLLLAVFRRRRTELHRLPVPDGRHRPSRWQLRVR